MEFKYMINKLVVGGMYGIIRKFECGLGGR